MTVTLVGDDVLHLTSGTFMWVQSTHFRFDDEPDDRAVLAALVTADGYAHDYASPFRGGNTPGAEPVHGRWRLSAIGPDAFESVDPASAAVTLWSWATEQRWTDPAFTHDRASVEGLERTAESFRAGALYRLVDPGDDELHDYGWVTGQGGFHEFVVIDRATRTVSVVVASDD